MNEKFKCQVHKRHRGQNVKETKIKQKKTRLHCYKITKVLVQKSILFNDFVKQNYINYLKLYFLYSTKSDGSFDFSRFYSL